MQGSSVQWSKVELAILCFECHGGIEHDDGVHIALTGRSDVDALRSIMGHEGTRRRCVEPSVLGL